MRRVHVALAGLILAVVAIGVLERPPSLEDADAAGTGLSPQEWDRRVHLAYWEKWASFEGKACQAMVDEFNRSQSEIYVHYVRTSQVDRKAMLSAIGGSPPDLVGLWDKDVPPFGEGEALLPLDDFMARSGLTADHYIPNYLAMCRYEGRTYALPTSPMTVALFWNKDHFRAKAGALRSAGLDPDRPPRTIGELDRYARVLTELRPGGSPRIVGFLPTEPGWFNYAWGYYFGGRLYDAAAGRITADAPENVEAYVWLKQFAEHYGSERLLRFRSGFGNYDSPQNGFIDGKVSMVMQGVWFPNFIRRHRPHMAFGVAPFPTAEGVPGPRSLMECDIIGIPRGAPHPEEAWRFIHYVQTRGLGILCRLQGKHLPIREAPPAFHEGHPNLELEVFARLAASPHSFGMPRLIIWGEYRDEMTRAFEHLWNWPVPERPLEGLQGEARRARRVNLIRDEVEGTLGRVRKRIQAKLDRKLRRDRLRAERSGP